MMSNLNTNIFDTPHIYRDKMLTSGFFQNVKKHDFLGKSIVYLFLTRFCSVGCKFCFFKSAPAWRPKNVEDSFSAEGTDKLINFINAANVGYTVISGGGEPLNEKRSVLKIIENIKSDRIVINTSANWAVHSKGAEKYLGDLYKAYKSRKTPTTLIIKQSISEGHVKNLGLEPFYNLLKLFRSKYKNEPGFKYQIHSFNDDIAFKQVQDQLKDASITFEGEYLSDNDLVVKKIPYKYNVKFEDGFEFVIGLSNIFFSSLRANLNDISISKAINVFETDLIKAEDRNGTNVINYDGSVGLDWAINYNGNISTWQNQINDNILNLYEDEFNNIYGKTFNDPLTYSIIKYGTKYRDRIISEVNKTAVKRTKSISLRDYSGAIIFDEWKDRLYFSIRTLQELLKNGIILDEEVRAWPHLIQNLLSISKNNLISLYKNSNFSIIEQYKLKDKFDSKEWRDLFQLINLGHYNLSSFQIEDALEYYNLYTNDKKLSSLKEVGYEIGDIERRLTERFMHIKPSLKIESSTNNEKRI